MKDIWIRLPRWIQVMSAIGASAMVLALADKVVGQCYVWKYTVSPCVEKRVEPMEKGIDYIVHFIQETNPDSVIHRVDSTFVANQEWQKRIRGKQ